MYQRRLPFDKGKSLTLYKGLKDMENKEKKRVLSQKDVVKLTKWLISTEHKPKSKADWKEEMEAVLGKSVASYSVKSILVMNSMEALLLGMHQKDPSDVRIAKLEEKVKVLTDIIWGLCDDEEKKLLEEDE